MFTQIHQTGADHCTMQVTDDYA